MKRHTVWIFRFFTWAVVLGIVACSQPSDKTPAGPEALGLSAERLDRIGSAIGQCVAEDRLAGGVALVARHGQTAYLESFGMLDREAQKPMPTDALFRICSMTKPVTSVAVMMLYEEGHFLLGDPVSDFIPEFKDMKVLDPPFPEDETSLPDSLVEAKRPITIHHLLTHTSGLTYRWNPRLRKLYTDNDIGGGLHHQEGTIGDLVKRLATIPLLFQPGDAWMYGVSDDVLGYLVEVVSGMTLDEFFQERIFDPLGMEDTHFFLPEGKVSRLATAYAYFEDKGLLSFPNEPLSEKGLPYTADYPYAGPMTCFSGGGGLCSTAEDYLQFCQMMLNGGELNGVRLLSRKSVELISQNQVGDLIPNAGFGLGFGTYSEPAHLRELGSIGAYFWGGFFFTSFVIDPREDMIAIFMGQMHPAGGLNLRSKVLTLAYQSIID